MKANELRIYNLLEADVELTGGKQRNIVEVSQISRNSVVVIDLNCALPHELTFDQLIGIPLTKEYLLKFGCKKRKGRELMMKR